ncbi:MAG TPA: UDP-glucose/GDP-mannose dehydrogenase family protein [Terriglobales bacterium]|nr:UDP-glucose/GDP-mannose dehydrogenase family protein [Terriglobales bacterium]
MNNGNHKKAIRIAVLGMGHVGLPTALGLAELGWDVVGADDDTEKIQVLQSGKASFFEPGMQALLSKHLGGRFRVTTDVGDAVASANVLFVCVGTPQGESGEADLSCVEAIPRTVASNLNGYKLIVEKSTVPAITAQWIKRTVVRYAQLGGNGFKLNGRAQRNKPARLRAVPEFDVASNPEFLQEGRALENFFHPDRIVLGVDTPRARDLLEAIYRPLKCPMVVTNPTTAELIKHAANAFLSTKISFINLVSDICEAVGADVANVAKGIGLDPRIGTQFLSAGIGFGGYCFPKDLRAFIHLGEGNGVDCTLLRAVESINQARIDAFLEKIREALWVVSGKTIAILGLAFKPQTDDIREAPSLKIIQALLREGANLRLYDPEAIPNARQSMPEQPGRLTYCASACEAVQGAHALALLTEWDEFRRLDLARVRTLMEVPIIVDGRNLWEPEAVRNAGFEYHCMGRRTCGHAMTPARPRLSARKRPRAIAVP